MSQEFPVNTQKRDFANVYQILYNLNHSSQFNLNNLNLQSTFTS